MGVVGIVPRLRTGSSRYRLSIPAKGDIYLFPNFPDGLRAHTVPQSMRRGENNTG